MEAIRSMLLTLVGLGILALGGFVVVGGGDGEFEHEHSVRIRAGKGEAFYRLVDPDSRKIWVADLARTTQGKPGTLEAGQRFVETLATPEGEVQRTVEITHFEHGERFGYRTEMEGATVEITFEVRSHFTGGQALLKAKWVARWEGRWQRLFEPVLSSRLRTRIDGELERLRRLAEQNSL